MLAYRFLRRNNAPRQPTSPAHTLRLEEHARFGNSLLLPAWVFLTAEYLWLASKLRPFNDFYYMTPYSVVHKYNKKDIAYLEEHQKALLFIGNILLSSWLIQLETSYGYSMLRREGSSRCCPWLADCLVPEQNAVSERQWNSAFVCPASLSLY